MIEAAVIAGRTTAVQQKMTLHGIKQNAETQQAMVDLLVKAQHDLAAITPTRGQKINITV